MSISIWKKALALCLAAVTVCLTAQSARSGEATSYVSAATIAELEARKQENNKKIQACESKLAEFSENEKQSKEYQTALQNKIDALQNNMLILDTELEGVKKKIFELDLDIDAMESTIAQQQIDIDEGLEEFKLRLRAMYVNGNDSLASALVGATDFYDLLSKYEVISCVAKHDNQLVSDLKQELESYNANLELLESQKAEQEQAEKEKEAKQSEMKASMQELREAYADSESEQERLALEKASANKTIQELEEDNKLAEQAEAEIREQIRRAEEERKRKESEEAAKKATTVSTERTKKETTTINFIKSHVKTTQTTQSTTSTSGEVENAPMTEPVILTKPANTTVTTTTTTTTTMTTTTTEALPPVTAPIVPATAPPTEAPTDPPTEAPTETVTETVAQDYNASAFAWPCPEHYYISSGFGSRWGTNHKGIDIAQNAGADAVASRAGKVIKINTSCTHNYGKSKNCCGNGYGNYVLIDHEDGTYSTMYAHLETVLVSVGDYVEKEQTIGYVGTTGHSTGYHLHFEIRKDGTAVNPSDYLNY